MDLPMFYNEEEEWKKVMLMYDSALKEVNTKLEILNEEFKLNHQYNPIEHITSRMKSPQSIAKKLRHNGRELTVENIVKYVNDVAGIRIICSFTSDIYRIADLIAKQSDVQVLKVKDYIMFPKSNGYTSYHMIISVPIYLSNTMVNVKAEIQIRTIAMDFWASLEHKIYYKFEGNAPERIRKELKECADIVSYLDHKMLTLNEEIKIYNHEAELDQYKEILSESFQDMIKDSYGTVIDDENEEAEETFINEPINYETGEAILQTAAYKEELPEEEDSKISDNTKKKDDKKAESKYAKFFRLK
jgi:putative GTP pyrophosphokinase